MRNFCRLAGRHLANAPRLAPRKPPPPKPPPPLLPPRLPPAPAPFRRAAAVPARAVASRTGAARALQLREARLHRGELRRRRARDVPLDLECLPLRLQRRHDLGHDPLLVLGEQRQAGRHRGDARDRLDLGSRGLLERQLRARQEEVVDEVLPGLAQLGQIGQRRLVGLDQVAVGPSARAATAGASEARGALLRREGHGQIGPDPGQGIERLLLRVVEAARKARDHDHEADRDAEPEQREDRPRASSEQLVTDVAQVERGLISPPPPQRELRGRRALVKLSRPGA